jgi:hypothetical protein
MDCFRRCNAYKGGVRGEKGGNDGRCLGERYFNKTKQKSTVKHAAQAAAKLAAPFLLGKFSTRSSTDALYKVGLKVAGE